MTRKTALITGVTGQDGGYLAERLVADGWTVHGTVHPAGSPDDIDRGHVPAEVTLHPVDFEVPSDVGALVRELRPSHVYNLASISSVGRSWEAPEMVAAVNGLAVVAILAAGQALLESGHEVRLVQASSAEIFGEAAVAPQTEHTPISPANPYGAAKAFAHASVKVFRSRGIHASNLILFNHESPRRPERFVSRKITAGAARISLGLQDRLTLGNLEARRDFGWAPDHVDAMIRASEHPVPGDYVIATGQTHSIREFVAAAFFFAGVDDWEDRIDIDPSLVRPADAAEQVGDASHAREVLGWAPQVGFQEMIARMVRADIAALLDEGPTAGNPVGFGESPEAIIGQIFDA